jgi:kinesin family protein 3/17
MAGRIEGGIRVYARVRLDERRTQSTFVAVWRLVAAHSLTAIMALLANAVVSQIRPMIAREQTSGYARVVFADGDDSVVIEDAKYRARCAVTRTLTPAATQADAWHCVGDVIPLVLSGFNATILAYGHTSSGKTFTLFGNDTVGYDHLFAPYGDIPLQEDAGGADSPSATGRGSEYGHIAQAAALAMHPEAGLIPRALAAVFAAVGASGATATHEEGGPAPQPDSMRVFVSAMQIYNEDAFDLLDAEPSALEVRWSPEEGVFAAGLQEFEVESAAEALGVVAAAARARVVRETEYNVQSSRSHTIIQVTVERERHGDVAISGDATSGAGTGEGGSGTTRSKLNLVDLAGSERWDVHAASGWEDARVSELTSINSSLFVLTRVISALSEAAGDAAASSAEGGRGGSRSPRRGDSEASELVRGVHIPYRESVLTRLLQDSLGGNAVTCIFCTLTPSRDAVSESLNTLIFADAARRVMTRARVNDSALPDAVVIRKLREEVLRLRRETLELKEAHSAGAGAGHSGVGGSAAPAVPLPKAVEGMAVALRQVAAIVAGFEEEVIELGARAELEHVTGKAPAGAVPGMIPEEAVEEEEEDWDSLDKTSAPVSVSATAAGAAVAARATSATSTLSDPVSGAGGAAAGALTERALVFCAALSAVAAEALQPHSLRRAYAAAAAATQAPSDHALEDRPSPSREDARPSPSSEDARPSPSSEDARPSPSREDAAGSEMKRLATASGGGTGSTGEEAGATARREGVTSSVEPGRAAVRPSTTDAGPSSAATGEVDGAMGEKALTRGSHSARGPASKPAWESGPAHEAAAGLTDMVVVDPAASPTRLPQVRAAASGGGGGVGMSGSRGESAMLALPRVRLRDKRGRVIDVAEREASVRAAEEKRTAAELAELEKRMETNRKLQEWTQQKVQREEEAAAAMKEAEEAVRKEAKLAEARRLKRARRLKKQLLRQQRRQQASKEPLHGAGRHGGGSPSWDDSAADAADSVSAAPRSRASKASQSPPKAARSPRRPPSSPVGSARGGHGASGAMSVRSPRLPAGTASTASPRRPAPLDDAELERDVKAFLASGPRAASPGDGKRAAKKTKKSKKPISRGTTSSSGKGGTGGGGGRDGVGSTSARRQKRSPRHHTTAGAGTAAGVGAGVRPGSSAGDDYGVTAAGGGWDAMEDASSPWGHGDAEGGHSSSTAGRKRRSDQHTVSRALMEETNAAIAAADAAAEEAAWALAALNAPGLAGGVDTGPEPPGRSRGSAEEENEEENDSDYRYGGSRLGQRPAAVSGSATSPRGSSSQIVPSLAIGGSFARPEAGTAPASGRQDGSGDAMASSPPSGAEPHRQRATSAMDGHLVASVDQHAPSRAVSPMGHRPAPSDTLQPHRPGVQFLERGTALEEVLAAQGLRRQRDEGGSAPAPSGAERAVDPGAGSPRRGAGGVDAVSGAGGGHRVVVRRVHQPVVVSADQPDTMIRASPSGSGSKLPDGEEQRRQWAYDAASAPFSSRFGTQ